MRNPFLARRRFGLVALLAPVLAACAPGPAAPVGEPVPDPAGFAESLATATTPTTPQQASFSWTLDEAGSRVRGQGVTRFEAPDRLRLDLFGARGETYLAAALVGEEFRLPAGATRGVALPSPALLWAALGVIRPPRGAPLTSARTDGATAVLLYQMGDGETLEFRADLSDGVTRLTQVERRGRRGALETLHLDYAGDGTLSRTRYRDWTAYRDLVFESESLRDVPSFPEAIWRPDASSR